MIIEVESEKDMKAIAERIGHALKGGETIELVGDVGAGKTTFRSEEHTSELQSQR